MLGWTKGAATKGDLALRATEPGRYKTFPGFAYNEKALNHANASRRSGGRNG
jgi:hypothetical protein